MKRKFAGLALLAILIVSVTSGCLVREDYGYRHYRHHDRNYEDHGRYGHHDRDYHDRDYRDHD
jgi:hypothetical protein